MIAVDTNVLVRVLIDDPKEKRQVASARARVKQAGQVYIPQIVQVETVWVLETAYGLDKATVVGVLDQLLGNEAYTLQGKSSFETALAEFKGGKADFSDYLILAECKAAGYPLVTFDGELRKSPGATSVSEASD
ncbi:MAG: PIN domain-containing protein [Candidatus Binatia bacterium]